jgi:uncharacterized membrane protein
MNPEQIIEFASSSIDMLGVAIVFLGVMWGLILFIKNWLTQSTRSSAYKAFRSQIVRALVLGLDVLVAGDIIRTVAISPSLTSVGVLGAIVFIRCFLSWSLSLEIEGRWPWQTPRNQES